MGNLKRFLAMTLTMLMVVGCFAMSTAVSAFDDVVSSQKQIDLMTLLGIIQGYDEATFAPDDPVERWHMALWVAKIMTGKTDDAYTNWYNTVNYTDFGDVEVDHFLGSISYCNDNSIIIGTSPVTFEPTAGIMIQDVFTMVCRMLGYGSAAMNAQYPWSYVNKAMELGLDAGLADDYNNEEIASREEAAIILYNALFALKADGTTYAVSKFNLTFETIVLTGTSRTNMFATGETIGKTLSGVNYVAFNILGKDGNIISNPTYYLLKSDFGFDADNDENLAFGQSYKVVTNNNFETLLYCEMIEGYYMDQTEFDGYNDNTGTPVKIEGLQYNAVSAYTKLYNKQGTKTTDELEAIVYNVNGNVSYTTAESFVMDANLNILDNDGKILLYYQPNKTILVDWKDKYLYKISDGTYINPDPSIWARAQLVKIVTQSSMQKVTAAGYNSNSIYDNNAYSDNILYDDNGDGIYDRVFHTYYKFGFLSYNDDGFITVDGVKIDGDTKYTDVIYVDADGVKIAAADAMKPLDTALAKGNYVLYTYNTFTNYFTVKESFSPNVGLVTTISKPNGTVTFDQVYYNINLGNVAGTKFNIGNARLPGATKANVIDRIGGGKLDELHGKNVHFVAKDGNVLAIYEAYKNAGNYIVFDSLVGMNSTGYANALVYNNSNVRSVITIASLDADWYASSAPASSLTYAPNLNTLQTTGHGQLFSSTIDALGNYHLKWLNPEDDYTYYYNARVNGNRKSVSLKFTNGIAYPVINGNPVDGINEFKFLENEKGVAKAFTQFRTDANTVIVVLCNKNCTGGPTDANTLKAFKGIPTSGAEIKLFEDFWTDGAEIFVVASDDPLTADFIYVRKGDFKGTVSENAWNYKTNDTIIFVDDDTMNTETQTNQTGTGYGVTLGTIYSYNNAIDFINGGVYNNILTYNFRLQAGKFYRVLDGYVQNEVEVGKEIKTGYLQYIDTYESVLISADNKAVRSNYNVNYMYKLVGTNIVNETDKTTPLNNLATEKVKINTEESFAPVYYYDNISGLSTRYLDAPARVFIYKEVRAGTVTVRDGRYQRITLDDILQDKIKGNTITQLQSLDYTAATAGKLYPFNWFEISKANYDLLSEAGLFNNDPFNNVINLRNVGMKLYKGNTEINNFTDDNVVVFTSIAYTNALGYKYFLCIGSLPSFWSTNVGDGNGTYTLRWEKGLNIYNLTLPEVGVLAAHPVVISDNLKSTYSNGRVAVGDPTVKTFINYIDESNPDNLWYNVASMDVRALSGGQVFSTDMLIAYEGYDFYVKAPIREGYDIKVFYWDVNFPLITDGTNEWDSFYNRYRNHFDDFQDWHIQFPEIREAAAGTSLHNEFKVFKFTMGSYPVGVAVWYVKSATINTAVNYTTAPNTTKSVLTLNTSMDPKSNYARIFYRDADLTETYYALYPQNLSNEVTPLAASVTAGTKLIARVRDLAYVTGDCNVQDCTVCASTNVHTATAVTVTLNYFTAGTDPFSGAAIPVAASRTLTVFATTVAIGGVVYRLYPFDMPADAIWTDNIIDADMINVVYSFTDVPNPPAAITFAPLHAQFSVRAKDPGNGTLPTAINQNASYAYGHLADDISNAMRAIETALSENKAYLTFNNANPVYIKPGVGVVPSTLFVDDSNDYTYDVAYTLDWVAGNKVQVGQTVKVVLPILTGYNPYVNGMKVNYDTATTASAATLLGSTYTTGSLFGAGIVAYATAAANPVANALAITKTDFPLSGIITYEFTMPAEGAYLDIVYIPIS